LVSTSEPVARDYTVRLERVFHGPLDLLLHLVREQEVEIHEVEVSRVIEGYLAHLKAMRELDIEVAGDFLVMAATLLAIKSRSLLPRESVDLDDGLDPRDELIQRLVEYRRFRTASEDLGRRAEVRDLQHARGASPLQVDAPERELDLGEVTAWDLLGAFSRLLRETMANAPHRVAIDRRPLRFYVQALAERVKKSGQMGLRELVLSIDTEPTRESLVGSFCALLELCKLGVVHASQPEGGGEIVLAFQSEGEADLAGMLAASTFDDELPEEPAEGTTLSETPRASDAPEDADASLPNLVSSGAPSVASEPADEGA
jgi:segregation and condensation protein A